MDAVPTVGAVDKYLGLLRSTQYSAAATVRSDAVRELRDMPVHLGESFVIEYRAKFQAMLDAGADAETLHHEIHRPW